MSVEDNKQLAHRAYDALNQFFRTGDVDAFRASFGAVTVPEFVDHNPSPGQGPGLEGITQSFAMLRNAFPDAQITVEDLVAEGDKVVARLSVHGTHQGEFMGIPPTGEQVTQTGIDIVRIVDGKAVERWGQFDDLGLLQQVGAIPGSP